MLQESTQRLKFNIAQFITSTNQTFQHKQGWSLDRAYLHLDCVQFILKMESFRHLRHRQLVDRRQAAPELVADLLQAAGHLWGVEAGWHHLEVTVTYCIYRSRTQSHRVRFRSQITLPPSALISCEQCIISLGKVLNSG